MNDFYLDNKVREGTILAFLGEWGSGIAHLVVAGVHVPCDNSATVRCLDACFGNFIVDGHAYDANAIIGKRIKYTVDEIGVMDTLVPIGGGVNEVN